MDSSEYTQKAKGLGETAALGDLSNRTRGGVEPFAAKDHAQV
jgi:hypothetical protein